MTLTLDPATEQRLQRQLARGSYAEPSELLAHLLDLAETEAAQEDWLLQNKQAIRSMIEESVAAEASGESYSMEEAEAILVRRRSERAASRVA